MRKNSPKPVGAKKAKSSSCAKKTKRKMPRKARTMGEQRKALGCVIYDMLMVASAIRQLHNPPHKFTNLRFGDEQAAFEAAMLKCRALLDFLCLPPEINKHDIIITDLGGTPLTLSETERTFRTSVNQWCAHLDWQRVERKPVRADRPTVRQTITQGKSVLAKAKAFVEDRLANGFKITIHGGRYWEAFNEVYRSRESEGNAQQ